MFKGSMVAIITPFTEKGEVDEKAFIELVDWHVNCKTDAIVCAGTTGECPTLTSKEKERLFRLAIDRAGGKCRVIAGTGTYNTMQSVEITKKAKEMKADGCLIVVPYYNRPTQEGCLAHYKEIAKVGLPVIVYHHPGRTGVKLTLETFEKLAAVKNIVAVKEASSDMGYFLELKKRIDLPIFSGDDPLTVEMMRQGALGTISVIANLIPKEWKEILDLCLAKKYLEAKEKEKGYEELIKAIFLETNPHGIKYALSQVGKCKPIYRLPLVLPRKETKERIDQELEKIMTLV